MSTYPRDHKRLRRDITRDPIFLFQSKRRWYCEHMPYEYRTDDGFYDEDDNEVEEQRLIDEGWAGDYWQTDTVFLTREEGEAYGTGRAYNYPEGWRVYCVAAEGAMVDVLAKHTDGVRYH